MNESIVSLRDLIPALIFRATGGTVIDQSVLLLLTYLCDWHSCVKYNRKLTDIVWSVSRRGLGEEGLESFVRGAHDLFEVNDEKEEIKCLIQPVAPLPEFSSNIIERICKLYIDYRSSGLATFVFSTFPVLSSSSFALARIDLLEKAHEYAEIKKKEQEHNSEHK